MFSAWVLQSHDNCVIQSHDNLWSASQCYVFVMSVHTLTRSKVNTFFSCVCTTLFFIYIYCNVN